MTFITVGTVSFLVWAVLGKVRLLSVSFANFAGTLIFVALGLQFDPYKNTPLTILIGIGFYLFLALGETAARYTPIDRRRYHRLGRLLAGSRRSRAGTVGRFHHLRPVASCAVRPQRAVTRRQGSGNMGRE